MKLSASRIAVVKEHCVSATKLLQNKIMCLALYKPAGIAADWNKLQTGMEYNADGAGFAVAVDGQLIVEKGFFKFEDFKRALEPFQMYPAIVHFRMATHGDKNKANCHPFDLRDFATESMPNDHLPVAVIHNGIFSEARSDQKQWSDTWHICRDILYPLWRSDARIFGAPAMMELGDSFVGSFNKLVFLAADGTFTIWGESNGHWESGCWYSNYSYSDYRYADPRYRKSTSYAGKYVDGAWTYDDDEEWPTNASDKKVKFTTNEKSNVQLEVGMCYNTREGKVVGPLVETSPPNKMFPFKCTESNLTFTELGSYVAAGTINAKDIVSLCGEEYPTEDDFDSVINLDLELPMISTIAVDELRDCGYTDYELEKIYIKHGHNGLVEEMAHLYGIEVDDIESHIDARLRERRHERELAAMDDELDAEVYARLADYVG